MVNIYSYISPVQFVVILSIDLLTSFYLRKCVPAAFWLDPGIRTIGI